MGKEGSGERGERTVIVSLRLLRELRQVLRLRRRQAARHAHRLEQHTNILVHYNLMSQTTHYS